MNAWLKRCVFNLDLNRESVSEPRTFSGRLFHSLGARYEKVLPPFVDFAILGTRKDLHVFLILDISDLHALLQLLQETCLYVTKHVQ